MHYSCLVIDRDNVGLEAMLEPYDDENIVAEEIRYDYEELVTVIREFLEKGFGGNTRPENCESLTVKELVQYGMDNIFPNERLDEKGNLLYLYNPNGIFDWYKLGGRFSGRLAIKGTLAKDDEVMVKNIDWERTMISADDEDLRELRKDWNKDKQLQEKYPNIDDFINSEGGVSFYYIIGPDPMDLRENKLSGKELVEYLKSITKPDDMLYAVDLHE